MNYLQRINWPRIVRFAVWWAVLVYAVGPFLKATIQPIFGFWPTMVVYMVLVIGSMNWVEHMQGKDDHNGRFWWVWWNHKDVRIWRGMSKPERAICSAYKVPPSLVGTKRVQGPQNG